MNEIIVAAGYVRVSTKEQAMKNTSVETQIAEIQSYAKLHNMKLAEIYIDRGITARKSLNRRIDFMRMMKDVEAGKINHIIVLRLDRFFRNVYDYHRMMNEYLLPHNCDWSAAKEQYSTATTNGRLMINLRLSIAEQECDTDSDRIKDVQSNRVSQGYVISTSHPIGLKIENKRMCKDPETIHIAEDMFEHFEMTNSVRSTMNHLNNTYGLKMIYASVSRALRNPIYAGIYRNNMNFCEPTISVERHKKILKMLAKNIKVKKDAQNYIFTGLVYCYHCGASMSGNCTHKMLKNGDSTYRYYRCPKKTRDCMCTNNISIREEEIEQYLLENVEEEMKKYIVTAETEAKQKKIKSNRKQIEKKMQRLNDLYINDFINMEKYKAEYAALEAQIIDEPEETKKDLSVYKDLLNSDFKTIYKTLSEIEKRALWRTIIQKIRVSGKEVKDFKIF